MNRSYQITMHAISLRRWFDAADSIQAWLWPEPKQLELPL